VKRRPPAQPHEADDIIFGDVSPVEKMDWLQLPSDIAQELVRIAGKRGPVELNDNQLIQLCAYGRAVARHKRPDATILVLCDDLAQHLVVIKGTNPPHFAFFPN
jgi:hypothetical protein